MIPKFCSMPLTSTVLCRSWKVCSPTSIVPRSRYQTSVLLNTKKTHPFQCRKLSTGNTGSLRISEEVRSSVDSGKAVVALESTIITHGMPYPHNYSTAKSVEKCVRDQGAVPATIAVLNGKLCVGLTDLELQYLAEDTSKLWKVSRRDMGYVLSQRLSGGTTVSGTMIGAHLAGIHIFATGGIGGVHRGAETSFDVSADLTELGRTPVAVVSAGVKSILDIPKTLEYLETQGVCVATFGRTQKFPAFFTSDSGHLSPCNVQSALEAAKMIDASLSLGLSSGLLIAVPIPEEQAGKEIQSAIDQAVEEARVKGIQGRAVTPYILSRVNSLTQGESLTANIALVENNARVAGSIARSLAELRLNNKTEKGGQSVYMSRQRPSHQIERRESSKKPTSRQTTGRPIVIGATVLDLTVQIDTPDFQFDGGCYPGHIKQTFGGVGRNLADCLARMGTDPVFVSGVGCDVSGKSFLANSSHMDLSHVFEMSEEPTACYSPLLRSSGHLMLGVGDMSLNESFDPSKLLDLDGLLQGAPLVILDGNFSPSVIQDLLQRCGKFGVPVWFEPTDLDKAMQPFHSSAWRQLSFVSPNTGELRNMWQAMKGHKTGHDGDLVINPDHADAEVILQTFLPMCKDLCEHIPCVVLTLGPLGVCVCHNMGSGVTHLSLADIAKGRQTGKFSATYYPEINTHLLPEDIVSVSGAGDCFASGFIQGLLQKQSVRDCVQTGMLAAGLSLVSTEAIPSTISMKQLHTRALELEGQIRDWTSTDVTNLG